MSFIRHKIRGAGGGYSGTIRCDGVLGLDSTRSFATGSSHRAAAESSFEKSKLPGTLNTVRCNLGQIRKRPGFSERKMPENLPKIDGMAVYTHPEGNRYFFLADGVMYVVYESGIVEHIFYVQGSFRDFFAVSAGKFVFFINKSGLMYVYDCEQNTDRYFNSSGLTSISDPESCYLPTAFIGGLPSGSASPFESANLLNPFVAEQFIGNGSDSEFTVHFSVASVHSAYIKNASGAWVQTQAPTFDGQKIKFSSAPPKPALTGEDNVRIVYRRAQTDFKCGNITNCRCAAMFGIGGFEDRLFLSGNPFRPGYVYYSEMNNPLYFPETNYIRVGSDSTKVKALSGQDTRLYVICNDSIYCVSGKSVSDSSSTPFVENSVFAVSGMLETPPPTAIRPVIFDNEVNYMTSFGVCAVTASGVLDERCCQIRSSYINGFLKDIDLENCIMQTYRDFLIISDRKDRLFVLDGKQFSEDADLPFSHRQYEGYIWDGIPAKFLWAQKDGLYFSDGEGIYAFDMDFELSTGVNSDTYKGEKKAINAYFETPELYTKNFDITKFFMKVGVLSGENPGCDSDIKISAVFDTQDARTVKDYDGFTRAFVYAKLGYGIFTYASRAKRYGFYKRNLHKKGRSLRLRFENGNMDESFVLRGYSIDYLYM